jgi:hypothetical protein
MKIRKIYFIINDVNVSIYSEKEKTETLLDSESINYLKYTVISIFGDSKHVLI